MVGMWRRRNVSRRMRLYSVIVFWWIIFMPAVHHVFGPHSKFRSPSDDAAHFASAQLLDADGSIVVVEHQRHDVTRTVAIGFVGGARRVLDRLMPRHHAHCAELHDGV